MNYKNELIKLMTRYRINCISVAKLISVKPNTVRVWRSKSKQDIPQQKFELLKFKLEASDD